MTAELNPLVDEARRTGTISGLPGQHWIDGQRCPSVAGGRMETLDPGTGRAFATVAAGDAADVERAIAAARKALTGPWGSMVPAERGRILARTATLIRACADRLAIVEALDAGKRLVEAQGDVGGAARAFEYYSGACDKFQGSSIPLGPDYIAYTRHEPIGVVAQIVPWNYPISTLVRGLAPALAAGCTVVAKPAEQTPLTALMLGEILAEAGLPAGVFNVVTGTGAKVGEPLVAHPGIDHITFTGSVATGIRVMQNAAPQVTRLALELGGKSPVIVLADADLDAALDGVMGAIFENAGQICSAGSRLIVERAVHDRFVEMLVERARGLRLGHGLRDVDMGPVNSLAQIERISGFVERARRRGAAILCGGRIATDPETGLGWFYEPTILDGLSPDDEAIQSEIFGPVLCVQVAETVEHAVTLANGTPYALVAGIYTRDLSNAHRIAARVDAGQVYINEFFAGGIETPFGGNRASGFGRAKGLEALASFSKLKCVTARL
ncbi:MAG: aldehyde dehydrogenase family protein [Beijerinckiaceae bacterium]|jgi:acyl-CoA reductase-like NAD-dependent aldehyde dehydrogenase|nr:aldehyde dehydrogenase family protein [Beijerinckiaceae bacterium]